VSALTLRAVRKMDLVQMGFDNGMGGTILYGIVEQAGPKSVTILWESGLRNRVRRLEPKGITPVLKGSPEYEMVRVMREKEKQ